MGWLKIQKLEYLDIGTKPFYETKKFLTSVNVEWTLKGLLFVLKLACNKLKSQGKEPKGVKYKGGFKGCLRCKW